MPLEFVAAYAHALNAIWYAAGLGEDLPLPFSSVSWADQCDIAVEMKPAAERLLSLEWCGDASCTTPETFLGGLGLWSGMISSAPAPPTITMGPRPPSERTIMLSTRNRGGEYAETDGPPVELALDMVVKRRRSFWQLATFGGARAVRSSN
jgi:hypothetical protein